MILMETCLCEILKTRKKKMFRWKPFRHRCHMQMQYEIKTEDKFVTPYKNGEMNENACD